MTLNQLKYFQTICKYNNITRAAAELHISQPSLSNAIHELEQEFGVALFIRRSRGLELTSEGRYCLNEANLLLDHAEQLTTHMQKLGSANHTITLGLPAMSGSLVFARLLNALHNHSPETQIQVMESGSLANREKVIERTLDAAIITRNTPLPSGYGYVPLRPVNICLYVSTSHPLAHQSSLSPEDLDHLPLAMLPEDTFLDKCIHQYYQANHLNMNIVVRTNQLVTIQQLILNNTVASFLLEHVLDENSDIVKIPITDLSPAEIDLIWKSDRQLSPPLRQLIAAAKSI